MHQLQPSSFFRGEVSGAFMQTFHALRENLGHCLTSGLEYARLREIVHSCHGILLPIQLLGILDEHSFFSTTKNPFTVWVNMEREISLP